MKIKVRISNEEFANKEQALERTGGFKAGWAATDTNLTVEELAAKWISGYSILPAKMRGKKSEDDNWTNQQVFAVDFDNENGDKERVSDDYYVTHEEALEMARQAGLSPAFIYSSFSSSEIHQKFRMVFILNDEITTKQQHNEVTTRLYSAFMKGGYVIADTKCSDLSRIYYGGRNLLYQDYDAVTMLSKVMKLGVSDVHCISRLRSKRGIDGIRMNDYIPASLMHSDDVRGVTTSAMTALINGDPHKLREIIHNGVDSTLYIKENTGTVHTNINPYRVIKQFPLHHILGVPLNVAFRCIMHGHLDTHPSANVQLRKDGTYAYYCHGCYGEGNGQSLIDLIMEATGCGIGETVAFAETAFDISLQTDHQLICRRRCDHILRFIDSHTFRTGKWEPLYLHMKRKKLLGHYRYYVEQSALYTPSESMLGEGIPTLYQSVRETADRMDDFSFAYCSGIDKNSVSKKRNELADLGLIGKSTNMDHPAYAKAKAYQRRQGNEFHKEFLFIPELTIEILDFALDQIVRSKTAGERAKFRTKASVVTARGEEASNRIFAQSAGKELSKYHNDFITFMMRTTTRLCSKGWTTEDEIIEEIIRTSKHKGVKSLVGQFRPLLTNGECFTLELVSKELRNKLNLPESLPTRKKIIVKIDNSENHLTTNDLDLILFGHIAS
ncbi:hypothetical protein GNP92_05035 [Paenibacillus timonensis]|nr:hypothetical protein [Paenibacillus timonensis]MUG85716.1 hypothetical protein [Paenibacillus timonensis]